METTYLTLYYSQMELILEDTLKEIKIYKRESFNDIIQKLYNIRVDKNE